VNELTKAGRAAMRARLLAELELTQWHLSHTAERLCLHDASAVVREIKRLGLVREWEHAKVAGLVTMNGRRGRVAIPGERRAK
jgi:hypothetical protein